MVRNSGEIFLDTFVFSCDGHSLIAEVRFEGDDFCYLSLDTSSIFKSTSSFRQECANPLWLDGDSTARTVLTRRLLNP
jgi:hypothetical protein